MKYKPELRSIPLTFMDCSCKAWRDFEYGGTCFNKIGYEIGLCNRLRKEKKCPKGFQ